MNLDYLEIYFSIVLSLHLSYILKIVCVLSFKYRLFKQFMFWAPPSQLMPLTSNTSADSRVFSSSVRNRAGPCFFISMPVNVCQILFSFNHTSYEVLYSKDGEALKFDAINES